MRGAGADAGAAAEAVLAQVREPVAVGIEVGVGRIARVESVADLPAVGHAVAVEVAVRVHRLAKELAVGVVHLRGRERGRPDAHVGDRARERLDVPPADERADAERGWGVGRRAGGERALRDLASVQAEFQDRAGVGERHVVPLVRHERTARDFARVVTSADTRGERAVLADEEREAVVPLVRVARADEDRRKCRQRLWVDPRGSGDGIGERQLLEVGNKRVGVVVRRRGHVRDAVEPERAAAGGVRDAPDAVRVEKRRATLARGVGGLVAVRFREPPPALQFRRAGRDGRKDDGYHHLDECFHFRFPLTFHLVLDGGSGPAPPSEARRRRGRGCWFRRGRRRGRRPQRAS